MTKFVKTVTFVSENDKNFCKNNNFIDLLESCKKLRKKSDKTKTPLFFTRNWTFDLCALFDQYLYNILCMGSSLIEFIYFFQKHCTGRKPQRRPNFCGQISIVSKFSSFNWQKWRRKYPLKHAKIGSFSSTTFPRCCLPFADGRLV